MLEIERFWHLDSVLMLNGIIWNKTVLTLTFGIAQSDGDVEDAEYTSADG